MNPMPILNSVVLTQKTNMGIQAIPSTKDDGDIRSNLHEISLAIITLVIFGIIMSVKICSSLSILPNQVVSPMWHKICISNVGSESKYPLKNKNDKEVKKSCMSKIAANPY